MGAFDSQGPLSQYYKWGFQQPGAPKSVLSRGLLTVRGPKSVLSRGVLTVRGP